MDGFQLNEHHFTGLFMPKIGSPAVKQNGKLCSTGITIQELEIINLPRVKSYLRGDTYTCLLRLFTKLMYTRNCISESNSANSEYHI